MNEEKEVCRAQPSLNQEKKEKRNSSYKVSRQVDGTDFSKKLL